MKVIVISTPIHDALGITTVSASTETEIHRIAQIDFASFLTDIQLLTIALYGSHPSIWDQYSCLPCDDYRRIAAKNAKDLHHCPSVLSWLIDGGFFNSQLQLLLNIGHYNSDHGAKLASVFVYMLEHQEEHYLDATLVENMQRFLAKRDFVDGFTIIEQTSDACIIMPSTWRKEVA